MIYNKDISLRKRWNDK